MRAQVFQINDADSVQPGQRGCQFGGFNKLPRSQQRVHSGSNASVLHARAARRVVEHGGHAAHRAHAENQADGAGDIGQQHAEGFARRADFADQPPQCQTLAQQLAVTFFILAHVFDQARAASMHAHGVEKRAEQRLHRLRGEQHFLHRPAHGIARHAPPQFGAGSVGHGNRGDGLDRQRNFRKQAARILPGQAAEIRARRTIQPHWQDGCAGLGGNKTRAVVDLHQAAGQRDAAFREDHHRLARFKQADDFLHCQRAGGIDRQVRHIRQ